MSEAGPDWRPCRAIITHDDGRPPVEDDGAEFEIAGGRLLLVYFDERGAIIFEGREAPDGGFALMARSRPRKAHVTLRGAVLEGRWHEGDETGSIRVELLEVGR